jgi:4-hydroxy-tetrahydrodipicolinate reductase
MKLAIVGYGRMGKAVEKLAVEAGHVIVAKLDLGDPLSADALEGTTAAIEFTTPEAAPQALSALAALRIPTVSGTTGWYEYLPSVTAAVESHGSGLIYAPNFSLGVALFRRLVRTAARLANGLANGLTDGLDVYDLALRETHHRGKVDHPSGTARSLAEEMVEVMARKHRWAEGPPEGIPDPETLWVSVAREGAVPGTHSVSLDSPDDRITLTHEARSRDGFARGALMAADWISGRRGVFTLEDVLRDRFGF